MLVSDLRSLSSPLVVEHGAELTFYDGRCDHLGWWRRRLRCQDDWHYYGLVAALGLQDHVNGGFVRAGTGDLTDLVVDVVFVIRTEAREEADVGTQLIWAAIQI